MFYNIAATFLTLLLSTNIVTKMFTQEATDGSVCVQLTSLRPVITYLTSRCRDSIEMQRRRRNANFYL